MQRNWVIAPVESKKPELFDRVWQFDLENGLISIGWSELGDVSQLSREELAKVVADAYREKPLHTQGLFANMLWNFFHEIKPGNYIVARRGRMKLAGVGEVSASAFYSPGKNPLLASGYVHSNFIRVNWHASPREKSFPSVVFPMHTVAEISDSKLRSLIDGVEPPSIDDEADDSVDDQNAFALEKHLEDFIVENFDSIFQREMRIFIDENGNEGQQYATEIGPIDILAFDPRSNSFVVIELKKGRPADKVVGQILRYMGWVKENLCKNGQSVRGLVICREPDQKLRYALAMTDNIDVRYHRVSFELRVTP